MDLYCLEFEEKALSVDAHNIKSVKQKQEHNIFSTDYFEFWELLLK